MLNIKKINMKNVLIICIALLGFNAIAQKKDTSKREARSEMKQNLTAEQKAELKSKKMTLALDLSEKQQKEVNQLFLKEAKEREALKKDGENRKELSETERFERKTQMMDKLIAHKKEMKSILNQTQYTKWEKSFGKHKKREGKKRRGEKKRG